MRVATLATISMMAAITLLPTIAMADNQLPPTIQAQIAARALQSAQPTETPKLPITANAVNAANATSAASAPLTATITLPVAFTPLPKSPKQLAEANALGNAVDTIFAGRLDQPREYDRRKVLSDTVNRFKRQQAPKGWMTMIALFGARQLRWPVSDN